MNYIAYYRVSTQKQGQSGLGLEAQEEAVKNYVKLQEGEILEEFTEVESGKKNDRPELEKALKMAKRTKSKLLIAKLDRLSRSVAFIATLMESGAEFVAVDNPHANELMLHIMGAFAQHERKMISKRIIEALAQAKEKGVELGKYGKEVLSKQNRKEADKFAWNIQPIIQDLKDEGFTTGQALADELNYREIATARGGRWHKTSVQRLLKRIEFLLAV